MSKHYINTFLIICFSLVLVACDKSSSIKQYTITFDTNGGSLVESMTIDHGSTLPNSIITEKEGYLFIGWYLDSELNNIWDLTTDSVTSDMTLYSKWIYPFKQTVTETYIHDFTANGLVSDDFTIEGGILVDLNEPFSYQSHDYTKAYVFEHMSKITITTTTDYARIHIIAFTNESSAYRKVWIRDSISGSELNFWNIPELKVGMLGTSGSHEILRGDGYGEIHILSIKVVENSIPPTPQEDEHLITIFPFTNDVFSYLIVKNGDKIPELGAPVNEGHIFLGWYTNYDYETRWDFNTLVNDNVFLVAKWEKNTD